MSELDKLLNDSNFRKIPFEDLQRLYYLKQLDAVSPTAIRKYLSECLHEMEERNNRTPVSAAPYAKTDYDPLDY